MKLVNLIEEDFVNYRKPGMFLGFPYCSGKCNTPGCIVCQNEELRHVPERDLIDISAEEILNRYAKNPIPKCLIFGGLEPFDSFNDMCNIIHAYSEHEPSMQKGYPEVIIYTGFYPHEIAIPLNRLTKYSVDLIVKFGRFIPNRPSYYDQILGVKLASDNQFALHYLDEYHIWYMKP